MANVFVKGYMRNARPVAGYTRRQMLKARFILNKINKKNQRLILKHGTANTHRKEHWMSRIVKNNERGRRIINRYF